MRNFVGIFARAGVVDKEKSLTNTEAADKGANGSREVKTQKKLLYKRKNRQLAYSWEQPLRVDDLWLPKALLLLGWDNLGNFTLWLQPSFHSFKVAPACSLSESTLNQRVTDIATQSYRCGTVATAPMTMDDCSGYRAPLHAKG